MKSFLRLAGRNGASVVIAGVVIGILIPRLSEFARPFLAIAIFAFTFGSFLKFDAGSMRGEAANLWRNSLMIAWATLGMPLLIVLLISIARPGPELAQGLLFWALVPVSPACVAFAAILGLNIPIALLATVVGTALAPFYIPALADLIGGYQLNVEPFGVFKQLVTLIGGAFLASVVVKRLLGQFVKENPEAMTGIAVLAMFLAGMGSMRGMQARIILQPEISLEFVALAFGLLFAAELVGALVFWRYGRTAALTAGLISGTRTITLAWVILGENVLPMADLFLATSMVAKYTAPGLTKWLLWRITASGPGKSLETAGLISPSGRRSEAQGN